MHVRRTFPVLLLCISINLFGQKDKIKPGDLSPIFDISPDNKTLVLSISNRPVSELYLYSIPEAKLTQLTSDKGYYSRPVFSPDGETILFLSKGLEAETSDLCSIDLKSRKITKLTDGKMYVTEAAFMPGGKDVIYCGAGTITNYSPLARKAPHDIDLYSIKVDGGEAKKLTNFHAYQFASISPNQKGDTVLCKLIVKGVEGIYLISLSDTVRTKIEAVNNPRPEIRESFYDNPAYTSDNKRISFMAPYQVYFLNLADKKCEEIWSTLGNEEQAMPIFSRFDSEGKKLYFGIIPIVNRQYARSAQIHYYDAGTKKTTQVMLPMVN